MTSPLVATNVALARATVRVLRDQIGGFADRVLRAAGLTAANVTAANGEQALRLLRSRPTELPKAVVAAAVVQAFAKLAAVSNVVLNIATLSERLDSQPLSFRALDLMNALTRVVTYVDGALRRIEGLEAAVGLRGLGEISDWLRFSAVVALFSGLGVVAGAVLLVFAEMVDKIDGLGSEAAEAAQAACEAQARASGRPCTPEQYAAFFRDERTRERQDSLTNKMAETAARVAESAGKAAGDAVGGALFWLLVIGGVGTALYFAAPAIAERGVQTARRIRS
jgi:hypothetical protein